LEIMIASPVFSALSPADLAWSAAAERVKSYLRAHRVAGSRQVDRLAADIVGIARARYRPGQDPTALAMETLESGMRAWFGQLLESGDADATLLTRGRMALAMGEVLSRWPEHFLRDGAAPAELIRVMRASELGNSPEIRLSHMAPPKPAARSTARPAWQASYRWPVGWLVMGVRAVVSFVGAALAGGR
jgi:hypothetical protein